MAGAYLSYSLQDGYVGNWLVAGSQAIPLDPDGHVAWEEDTGIEGAPVERGPVDEGLFRAGSSSGAWAYHACPEDHCVDHSGFYSRRHYLRSWAYTELVTDTPQSAILELRADGPVGVWLDGVPVFRAQHGTNQCAIKLQAGATPLLVRFECAAIGHTPHAMALRVHAEGVHVRLPTLIASTGRRTAFEQLTAGVYLERDVYEGDSPVVVRWPGGERAFCPAHVRLHGEDDSIHALADTSGEPGAARTLGLAVELPAGPLRVTLMPMPNEVYLQHTRIYHHLPLWSMGRQRYHSGPASEDLAARRGEALLAVAEYADSPFAHIARMAVGAWRDVDNDILLRTMDAPGSMEQVALLGMLYRLGDHEHFPNELQQPLEEALLHSTYSKESDVVSHAAEILAGQRYPRRIFADGQTGAWHRARGERLALDWMTSFGSYGSADPGAPEAMEREIVVLSHLADLAEDTHTCEMAAVCVDKLLFGVAVNSRQGVLGVPSRSGRPSFVKSGYLQPTAGVSRLLWGSGIYNHHVGGVLSLACASGYDPPPMLEAIAHDAPAEIWSRERHAPPDAPPTEIDLYKTPDYLLASFRSFSPTDHADWRVTFGPEAVVFANHPASSSESDSRAPGYWVGNAGAPRVAHWKDALIAVHRLENDDVFGFTHAYFPCIAFDDYVLRDGWAFARVGAGYLALTNSRGVALSSEGRYAFRELRAFGAAQTWLVQLGRAAVDGDFADFQTEVLTLPLDFGDLGGGPVRWTTLRGDVFSFGWSTAFSVNGEAQTSGAPKHYENVYTTTDLPCEQMEIRHRGDYLRLDFGAP